MSWISWFCNLRGNEFFCEVDDDYIHDDLNLCRLRSQMPYYDYALDLILDVQSSHGDMFIEEWNELIESATEMLYGLIHAWYILTSKGMAAWSCYRIRESHFEMFICSKVCLLFNFFGKDKIINRGLGLTVHIIDHCKLILKYPKGTNRTWVYILGVAESYEAFNTSIMKTSFIPITFVEK